MAEKQKNEDEIVRKTEPIIRQQQEGSPTETEIGSTEVQPIATPYAEFGGLTQSLAQRQQEAGRRREEAKRAWEQRLSEQESARLALVNIVRPKDTTQEQRKLRNLALGQAVGEFVGSLFGGIRGLGSSAGRGYVPKMPGMYRGTMERVRQLDENGILADQKFQGLMGSMLERNAADRSALAREQYRDASAEEKQLRQAGDYVDREAFRAVNRRDLYERQTAGRRDMNEQQAKFRTDLQQDRHKQRLGEQTHAAALKSGSTGPSDEVKYTKMLLLPRTRTTRTQGTPFPTTTVADRTSYSKQEDAAAEVLAKQVAPIRNQYALSDAEVQGLQQAIMAKPKLGVTWDHVADALSRGMTPRQILESLE